MKMNIHLLVLFLLLCFSSNTLLAQFRLDVTGNSRLVGKVQIHTADTSSLFIGLDAGRDYPGGHNPNVGIGQDAGQRVTTGFSNTFVGNLSGRVTVSGYYNTFLGHAAGYLNTASNNTFLGAVAGIGNTTGTQNTFVGSSAGQNNKGGSNNTFIGFLAGGFTSTNNSSDNTYVGSEAGYSANDCAFNTFLGSRAGYSNSSGFSNTYLGYQAGYSTTTGWDNVVIGRSAGYAATTANANTMVGLLAGRYTTTGSANTFLGWESGFFNTTGAHNVFMGYFAGGDNTTGFYNTGIGNYALSNTTTAQGNTTLGYAAGDSYNMGYYNTLLGANSDVNANGLFNCVAVGQGVICTGSNQARLGNAATTSIGGYAGWTNLSDSRYKRDVKEDVPGMEFILKLRPVTYNLDVNGISQFLGEDGAKSDTTAVEPHSTLIDSRNEKSKIRYTGFLAQEVEAAAKSIEYDFSGVDKPEDEASSLYGLRYAEFVVPIVKGMQELNEEQENQAEVIAQLQAENNSLKAENEDIKRRLEVLEKMLLENATPASVQSIGGTSIAERAELKQNAPNPFSDNTVIQYYIPKHIQKAQLMLTNLNGQIVKTIDISSPGSGQVTLASNSLSAGAYLYTLILDGQIFETKTMVLTE